MSDPKRYTDLQVWEALHFGGSTNGWIRWEDYKRIVDRINEASLDAKNVNVVLIAENARLKAEVENSNRINTELLLLSNQQASEVRRLKAEVERLRASSFVTAVPVEEYEKLKAEVERLTKAHSDALADFWAIHKGYFDLKAEVEQLRKEGKQP